MGVKLPAMEERTGWAKIHRVTPPPTHYQPNKVVVGLSLIVMKVVVPKEIKVLVQNLVLAIGIPRAAMAKWLVELAVRV